MRYKITNKSYFAGDKMIVTNNKKLYVQNVTEGMDLKLGFWCQVRNRLTGKTVLSQSAGRIKLTKPQGGVQPTITDLAQIISTQKGISVKIYCAGQGFPPPAYTWEDSSKRKISTSPILVISNTKPGTYSYVCLVRNKFGVDKRKTNLIVRGKIIFINLLV